MSPFGIDWICPVNMFKITRMLFALPEIPPVSHYNVGPQQEVCYGVGEDGDEQVFAPVKDGRVDHSGQDAGQPVVVFKPESNRYHDEGIPGECSRGDRPEIRID